MRAAAALSRAVGALLLLHRSTLRIRLLHGERYRDLSARGVPILFALWHGRMFLSIQAHRNQGIATMASQSKDGEIIARWLERNGYVVARGSSSRGGGTAFKELVRAMRSGRAAALTVDGPRGPARVVQPGCSTVGPPCGHCVASGGRDAEFCINVCRDRKPGRLYGLWPGAVPDQT